MKPIFVLLLLLVCTCVLINNVALVSGQTTNDIWGRGEHNLTNVYQTEIPAIIEHSYHSETTSVHATGATGIEKLLGTLVDSMAQTHGQHIDAVDTTKEAFETARRREEIARRNRELAHQKVIIKKKELEQAEEEYRIAIEIHEKAKRDLEEAWHLTDRTIIAHNEYVVNMVEEKKLINIIHGMMTKLIEVRKTSPIPDVSAEAKDVTLRQ